MCIIGSVPCTAPPISRRLNQGMGMALEEEAWMDGVVLNNVDGSGGGGVIDEEVSML